MIIHPKSPEHKTRPPVGRTGTFWGQSGHFNTSCWISCDRWKSRRPLQLFHSGAERLNTCGFALWILLIPTSWQRLTSCWISSLESLSKYGQLFLPAQILNANLPEEKKSSLTTQVHYVWLVPVQSENTRRANNTVTDDSNWQKWFPVSPSSSTCLSSTCGGHYMEPTWRRCSDLAHLRLTSGQ